MKSFVLTFLLSLFAFACSAQHLIAHRGASHDAPENTMAAFNLAWEQGADGIEGDFHLTADGKIICIHDKDTKRVADETLIVKESTLETLQQLDVGSWKASKYQGERAPTLDKVLRSVPAGKKIFVEIKCGPEIIDPLVEVLTSSKLDDDQIVIISFNADVIRVCKERMPQYGAQWLTSYKQDRSAAGNWHPSAKHVAQKLADCKADGLGCRAEMKCFDQTFADYLRQQGYPTFGVWTVDDPKVARFYQELGAWSITTNRPGWMREQLKQ